MGCSSCGSTTDALWLCDRPVGAAMGAVILCKVRLCDGCKFSTLTHDYCEKHARPA